MDPERSRLPHVDEHAVTVEAHPRAVWDALVATGGGSFPAWAAFALGCADVRASGPRPLATGSAVPGFHVVAADAPRELALAGRHRYSRYALTFLLDEVEGGRTRLRARTDAEFPGVRGRIYRGLVIGTRMHRRATRRMLRAVARRAVSRTPPGRTGGPP